MDILQSISTAIYIRMMFLNFDLCVIFIPWSYVIDGVINKVKINNKVNPNVESCILKCHIISLKLLVSSTRIILHIRQAIFSFLWSFSATGQWPRDFLSFLNTMIPTPFEHLKIAWRNIILRNLPRQILKWKFIYFNGFVSSHESGNCLICKACMLEARCFDDRHGNFQKNVISSIQYCMADRVLCLYYWFFFESSYTIIPLDNQIWLRMWKSSQLWGFEKKKKHLNLLHLTSLFDQIHYVR